jgi:hypothetical protein
VKLSVVVFADPDLAEADFALESLVVSSPNLQAIEVIVCLLPKTFSFRIQGPEKGSQDCCR